jgi:archaemetzincin
VIALWWIGENGAEGALLERVRSHVEAQFRRPARLWESPARPTGTFDARRRQHSSRAVLQWLIASVPPGSARVLGITDVDLCMPVLTFVFGEAQLEGTAAVVSLARLREPDPAKTAARLAKECVHELGHTFGLLHCSTPGCVMSRSGSVRAVDLKSARLCDACAARYSALHQDGIDVYRQDQNSRRR